LSLRILSLMNKVCVSPTRFELSSIFNSTSLPVVNYLKQITKHLRINSSLILQAEPGAGKTTLVPLALLETLSNNKKIILLEPRRLAARNAALRMASLLGEPVGQTVGFRIRDEKKVSELTRIEVITEGILIRMIQSDPEMANVDVIIFDEFHERSLDADLGLALLLEIQQNLRDDLKLLIMSATLDTKRISNLMNDASVVNIEGRSYPVDTSYIVPKKGQNWLMLLNNAVRKAIDDCKQDTLIFLPGISEIKKATQSLQPIIETEEHLVITPLYGDLPFSQQKAALLPLNNKRKIILATNIAETSVTIEGVDCVIDSGYLRQSNFDPNVGFDRLVSKRVSHASATQRAGRAGRLGPGTCYRLWQESESLRADTVPEILRADLASFVLELAQWGITDTNEISLLDKPNQGAYEQAQSLLISLSAIDSNLKITQHGKNILSLGVHPRIAHMLINSVRLNAMEMACLISAMLEEKDILYGDARYNPDFLARLLILLDSDKQQKSHQLIFKQAKRLKRKLNNLCQNKHSNEVDIASQLNHASILLAMAFPDRIAKKRGKGYLLANGSGVQVNHDFVLDSEFLVVIKQGGHSTSTSIYQAIEIRLDELTHHFSGLMLEIEEVYWDSQSQSVKAEQNTKLGDIIVNSKSLSSISPEMLLQGLICGIKKSGIENLAWTAELKQWQARVELLHQLDQFKNEFPDVSNSYLSKTLSSWLAPYLNGMNKLSQVNSETLSLALKSMLDWSVQKKLDKLAPATIKVASGSSIKIDYLQGDKPVLAVKLQEMFGEKTSPRIAQGLVPLVTHLLSPARRPLQITENLATFWENGYQDVKKEMKGKYPKHPWPDDPLSAEATKYTKRRK
jgi:ATP-dependent helicase HrpB